MKMTVKKMMVLVALAGSMTATAVTPLKRLPWLQAGDTIAILSPGGSVQQKVVDGGANTLRLWGFTPRRHLMPRTIGTDSGAP